MYSVSKIVGPTSIFINCRWERRVLKPYVRVNMEVAISKKTTWTFIFQPKTPILGIYPENTCPIVQKCIYTRSFIEALFVVVKYWKLLKYQM